MNGKRETYSTESQTVRTETLRDRMRYHRKRRNLNKSKETEIHSYPHHVETEAMASLEQKMSRNTTRNDSHKQ